MVDPTPFIRELAENSIRLEALTHTLAVTDQRAENRAEKLEILLGALTEKTGRNAESITRLNLIVFGVGGPAALAAFGSLLKLVL